MKPQLSVILCSHNPRPAYLQECLAALRAQTLPSTEWELLLIDNASSPTLRSSVELNWHPQARIILEPHLGLTHARLCGFAHASADTYVLVDDDNVLASHYLENVLSILQRHPRLGVCGASITGQFELEPPQWILQDLIYLAVRPLKERSIAETPSQGFLTPAGAGMVVTRAVASYYEKLIAQDKRRQTLDRQGQILASCGDTDLALCAWDMQLGIGHFPELQLTHLIPKERLCLSYMVKLHEGMAYSEAFLQRLRGTAAKKNISCWRRWKTWLRIYLKEPKEKRALYRAHLRGRAKAKREAFS